MKRPTSTISREVNRCGGKFKYTSSSAQRISKRCGRRPKVVKLVSNPTLAAFVEDGLKKRWSPAEIHARLIIDFPNDLEMRVSHETIYTSLYLQAKGGLKKELISALRSGRLRRRLRKRGESARRSILADIVPISDRPPQAADRAFPGHWESQCCCQATVSAVRMGSW